MSLKKLAGMSTAALVSVLLLLSGCSDNGDDNNGMEEAADTAKENVEKAAEETGDAVEEMGDEAEEATD